MVVPSMLSANDVGLDVYEDSLKGMLLKDSGYLLPLKNIDL